MDKFLLFTGAGFSKALSDKFPLTDDILTDIQPKLYDLNYLHYYLQSAKPNLEDLARVMSLHCQHLEKALPILARNIEYSQQLQSQGRAVTRIDAALLSPDVQEVGQHLQNCVTHWNKGLDYIHEQVLAPMLTIELEPDTETHLEQFIAYLKGKFELNIFTTNYDRAIRQIQDDSTYYLINGSEVDLYEIINMRRNKEGYCYIPLKGMLDWGISNKKRDTIYQTSEHDGRVPKIKDSAVMSLENTSGFRKWPHELLYNKFTEEVDKAKYLCFIGFSFRDDAINEAIKTIASEHIERIVIFTRAIDDEKATADNRETEEKFQQRVKKQAVPAIYHDKQKLSFIPLADGFDFKDVEDFVKKYFINPNETS